MSNVLKIGNDVLQAEVWPLGARLNQLRFAGSDMLDGSLNLDDATGPKRFNGAVVGPVANRIAAGAAEIDGRAFSFEKNEGGITTLHSGTDGVHACIWTVEAADETFLSLSLDLKDGHGGFPGNRSLLVNYEIIGAALRVSFEAETDTATWINLALHPFWTLDGNGREGLDIHINSTEYTPIDERKIPTGEIADVSGTIFDLRTPAAPSTEIDHNFVLTGTQPAVTLMGPTLRLDIETDAPGVQIFTGRPTGIAIEPQHFPDTPHHPNFPSILLTPGDTYRQVSTYRLYRR